MGRNKKIQNSVLSWPFFYVIWYVRNKYHFFITWDLLSVAIINSGLGLFFLF